MLDFLFRKKTNTIPTLPYTTDIHSHLIHGVDDGSKDIETSIQLIKKMKSWGVERIITTPHRTDETFENSVEIIEPKYLEIVKRLKDESIDIDFNYSFEYRMDEGFLKLRYKHLLKPLKDKYLLVENSFIQPLWNLDDLIFDLKLKGFFPILAHPERYNYYHSNKQIYKHLKSLEVLFQVNVLSLSGCYGKEVQDVSIWLLKNNMVDYLSTDLHHRNHVAALDQFLVSSQYKKMLPLFEDLRNDEI